MKRAGLAFLLCLAAALLITQHASTLALDFTIVGADQDVRWSMSSAPAFPLAVDPKFTIDTADAASYWSLAALNFSLPDIAPKFTIDNADTTAYWTLTSLSFELPSIAPKFIIDNADHTVWWNLTYPIDMMADTTPPWIVSPPAVTYGSGMVVIAWTTNEYSISTLYYGSLAGNTPYSIADPLFSSNHQASFPLPAEFQDGSAKTVFYKIQNKDRSGNSAMSVEYQFTVPSEYKVYLPCARK